MSRYNKARAARNRLKILSRGSHPSSLNKTRPTTVTSGPASNLCKYFFFPETFRQNSHCNRAGCSGRLIFADFLVCNYLEMNFYISAGEGRKQRGGKNVTFVDSRRRKPGYLHCFNCFNVCPATICLGAWLAVVGWVVSQSAG